jgi:hypothetical protein
MVDAARLSEAAIDRIEHPSTTPREISSRSLSVNAEWERCRSRGRIPPDAASTPRIDGWYRSNKEAIW